MANIENLLLSSGFNDEVDYCWEVLLSHFIMTVTKARKNNKKRLRIVRPGFP